MNKYTLTILITLFVITNTNIYSQFRGYDWGTDRQTIIDGEGTPELNDDESIGYEGEVGGRDCYIIFNLIDDKLQMGVLVFTKEHTTDVSYITDFEVLDEILKERYGSPTSNRSRRVIDRDIASNEYINEGMKLSTGAIGYQTDWELENLKLTHLLSGNDYEISHYLYYSSLNYAEMLKKQQVSEF